MQNPEIWSFKEPESTIKFSNFNNTHLLTKEIEKFNFNHLISVVIPDCLKFADNLSGVLLEDCDYYKIFNLNLSDLISPAFLKNFINKGKLNLLSVGTRIDCDNCCAITARGNLILSLKKDTYQGFGIEGKVSHFTQRIKDRFIVKIDLNDEKLQPEKAGYEKLKAALNKLEKFNVIINWESPDHSICPSSIAKYFHQLEYNVKLCKSNFESHLVFSLKTPTLLFEGNNYLDDDDLKDFTEWMGLVCLNGDFSGNLDDYLNNYEVPEPAKEIGQVRVLSWRGFYQSNQLIKLLEYLNNLNKQENKLWISVYIQGFSDSPIIENNEEQNYFTNGDNGNVLIFQSNNRISLIKQRVCAKRYK